MSSISGRLWRPGTLCEIFGVTTQMSSAWIKRGRIGFYLFPDEKKPYRRFSTEQIREFAEYRGGEVLRKFERWRYSQEWGTTGGVFLRDEAGCLIADAPLPDIGTRVECLSDEWGIFTATRVEAFQPGCGWMWETPGGWLIPGHPKLLMWRPL